MAKVICNTTLRKEIGTKWEKQTFTKGKVYEWDALSSTWQNKIVYNDFGQRTVFNETDFSTYFSVI